MSPRAVVTGAADGIGRAVALELAGRGYDVVGLDRDAERSQAVQTELSALGRLGGWIMADLAGGIDQACDALRALPAFDVLVHCAGISHVGRFENSDLSSQQLVLDINLLAPILLTQATLAGDVLRPNGTLVFISSLSHFVSYPGASVYGASKDGVAAYARSLRVALRPQHIQVLTVYPGPTRTAHARKYSPDNRRESMRMPPEVVARQITKAIAGRRATLIPGLGNQLTALLGRLAPGVMAAVMKKTLLDKLDEMVGR